MKKQLLNVLCRARAVVIVGSMAAMTGASAQGATIFFDDFESYADTAALNAVWPIGAGNDTQLFLDAGPAGSTNTSKTVHAINRQGRRDRTLPSPILPTASEPLVVEFDLYDVGGDIGANEYVQILTNPAALTQLIALGKSNLATTNGANDPTKYQARIAFPAATAGGVNWINLNTPRSVGWHTFKAEIFPSTVNFYVDGVLDTGNLARAGAADPFSVVRIGSGLSSRAEMGYYDNFSVSVVPEPTGLGLIAMLGASGMLVRRRKA